MKLNVLLFKDSNCNLCRLVQDELLEYPPIADVTIIHVNREGGLEKAAHYNVNRFPTILLIDDNHRVINRFEGFVDSLSININIDEYEAKCMVQNSKSAQV